MPIRQSFSHIAILLSNEASIAFNISSSHVYQTFIEEMIFISIIFNIWKFINFTCLITLGITYWSLIFNHLYNIQYHLIPYNDTDIHHDSIFAINYIHFHTVYIYTHMIHAEINLFVSFNPVIKLYTFRIIFYTFFKQSQAYRSSVVLQHPPHLLTLTVYVKRRVLLEFISIIVLAYRGWLLRDAHFLGTFKLETFDSLNVSIVHALHNPINIF